MPIEKARIKSNSILTVPHFTVSTSVSVFHSYHVVLSALTLNGSTMFWNITLPAIFLLISCSNGGKFYRNGGVCPLVKVKNLLGGLYDKSCFPCPGKANAKRGSRHDAGKLIATLCHYYSDASMGCKECFEIARSHRSNHNSSLLPPCKSVQGIKRRNWTLDEGTHNQARPQHVEFAPCCSTGLYATRDVARNKS